MNLTKCATKPNLGCIGESGHLLKRESTRVSLQGCWNDSLYARRRDEIRIVAFVKRDNLLLRSRKDCEGLCKK